MLQPLLVPGSSTEQHLSIQIKSCLATRCHRRGRSQPWATLTGG